MFGRGEKYVVPVMNLYPKDVVREVDDCFNNGRNAYITRVPFESLPAISIDKITMRKNPATKEVYFMLESDVTTEYMKSFRKGLGRFVIKDFKKNENGKKYILVRYTSDSKAKKVALVRVITKDEANELEDMKAYGAISGELNSWIEVSDPYDENGKARKGGGDAPTYSFEDENYYVVLKVVPYLSFMKDEEIIISKHRIQKKEADNWTTIEIDPFEVNENTPASHRVDEEPEVDNMNPPEDTLF